MASNSSNWLLALLLCAPGISAQTAAPVADSAPQIGYKSASDAEQKKTLLLRDFHPTSMLHAPAHSVPRAPSTREIIDWVRSCGCDLAVGSSRCTVLDPFAGAGTTGLVADQLERDSILIELNPDYAEIIRGRLDKQAKSPVKNRVVPGAKERV